MRNEIRWLTLNIFLLLKIDKHRRKEYIRLRDRNDKCGSDIRCVCHC